MAVSPTIATELGKKVKIFANKIKIPEFAKFSDNLS